MRGHYALQRKLGFAVTSLLLVATLFTVCAAQIFEAIFATVANGTIVTANMLHTRAQGGIFYMLLREELLMLRLIT